jgi:HPt (histidine-containing phosphotransfer) domain-containing protein
MNTDKPPADTGNRKPGRLFAGTGKISTWIRRRLGWGGAGRDLRGSPHGVPGKHHPCEITESFSSEMFVQLLLELPAHRRDMAESWQAGDLQHLRSCVHRLLGATVYCDAPRLEGALRELRRALHSGNASSIATQHAHALDVIDATLSSSGCR